ncbi:MAG TPA: permease prefix domain 1-containing protein [Steroidobacteraceae bacterium]|nr:permease prefix domain 1-containing protein [Steroidobacteraceae bacterium]
MDEMEQDRRAEARLAQRLLRGGVGLRHVRRTLRELRDHREDIVERMVNQGHDRAAARHEAHRLLGDPDSLVAQMTVRPELRSRARRFAWLLFVLGPMPMVCALGLLATLAAMVTLEGIGLATGDYSADVELSTYMAMLQWVAPAAAGLLLCWAAVRREVAAIWPVCAVVIVALSSGAINYHDSGSMATLAFGLYPFDEQRAVVLFFVLGLAYLLLRGRLSRPRPNNAL